MKCVKKCGNCKQRAYNSMFGVDYCLGYEMAETEADEIEAAATCPKFEEGTPDCWDDEYCPSSTNGDYGPGNPWNAPGMSVKDFI